MLTKILSDLFLAKINEFQAINSILDLLYSQKENYRYPEKDVLLITRAVKSLQIAEINPKEAEQIIERVF